MIYALCLKSCAKSHCHLEIYLWLYGLRQSNDFVGIERRGLVYKISLYVDDILFYVANPLLSIPATLSILDQFGKISGCKMNFDKSEMFPINQAATQIFLTHSPFIIGPAI